MYLFAAFLIAYFLGSIPFGLLITKAAGMGDIRQVGSGNIGATNVLRTGNKKLALLTLLLDGGKGWLAVWMVPQIIFNLTPFCGNERQDCDAAFFAHIAFMVVAANSVVIGHVFPLWLRFKGGKGVATAIGVYWGIFWGAGLIASFVWLCIFFYKRISSLAAVVTFSITPFIALIMLPKEQWEGSISFIILPLLPINLLILYRHKDNIRRLLNGTEPKFGSSK